jgi:A/G-specific adenine glycosylase
VGGAGTVSHGFTHFGLELDVLGHAGEPPDSIAGGEWFALAELPEAGLPTLFAKAARLALARA